MSTGPENPNAFRRGSRGATEDLELHDHQVTQSTILYLLQEATKLAPPTNQDCLESRVSEGLHESPSSSAHCISSPAYSHRECGSGQPDFTGSVLHSSQGHSPWEVMSLINLQCERLLHPGHGDGGERGPATVLTDSDNRIYFTRDKRSGIGVVPHLAYREETARLASGESNVSHSLQALADSAVQPQVCPLTDGGDCCAKAKAYVANVEAVAKNTGSIIYLRNGLLLRKESRVHCFLDETPKLPHSKAKHEVVSNLSSPSQPGQSSNSFASLGQHESQILACYSSKMEESHSIGLTSVVKMVDFTSALALGKDSNANICLTSDSNNNVAPQSCSQTVPLKLNSDLKSEPTTLAQEISSATSQSDHNKNCGDDGSGGPPDPEEAQPSSSQAGWRTRTPRKQPHPTRSANLCDPELQGVTFRMHTELDDRRDQCRLLITSNYSEESGRRSGRVRSGRSRSLQSSQKTSSSEEESDPSSLSKNKMCASCCTRKTPLWRDAEDGTPLCNACGIRYKKYRVRCPQCWHIPKKEGNSNSTCFKCGDELRLASHHKRTTW